MFDMGLGLAFIGAYDWLLLGLRIASVAALPRNDGNAAMTEGDIWT
jgi:hypothetical protein